MRTTIIFFTLLLFGLSVNGQENRQKLRDQIESRRVAYLSEKLDLTPEEAQQFWPVFNAYKKDLSDCRMDKERFGNSELSAEESETVLNEYIDKEQKAVDFKKNYIPKMKSIIGPQRTLKVFILDRKFKETMMRELKQNRDHRKTRRQDRN